MSIYASPDDPRLSRTPLPLYHELPKQPGPRASTPERIRERQVKSVSLVELLCHSQPRIDKAFATIQVPPPYTHKPRNEEFYTSDRVHGVTRPNPELVKDHFLHEGRLTEEQALFILNETTELMRREPNMLVLSGPITGTYSHRFITLRVSI